VHNLTKEEICRIAEYMLRSLSSKLRDMDIDMTFEKSALEAIADAGFDDVYGARPLRRAIQSNLEDAISEKILEGIITAHKSYVCKYEDGRYEFVEA
ncbi:MAG: ATP-dependent Clp protease ATP-binding subunit ClpC, partial [Clostridia bacterium]|nr:ATP-dependent Clp protease ATP-binding subunit ClpC [Clostridia bacterium]